MAQESRRNPNLVWLRRGAWLLLAGLLLLLCTLPSDRIMALRPLQEGLARAMNRVAWMVRLPAYLVILPLFPLQGHHLPDAHDVASSLLAPFFWYGAWLLLLRLSRRLLRRRTAVPTGAPPPLDPDRRRLLRTAVGIPVAGLGIPGGYAVLGEPQRLKVRRYRIGIRGLPAALDGLRIVHVSDTHYGPLMSLGYIESVAERANSLAADLLILTGDYVHRTPRSIEPGIDVLRAFRARLGAVAIFGNHEYWEGADACRAEFRRIGTPLLENQHLFVTPSGLSPEYAPGESLCIAGLTDIWEGTASFEKALSGVPEDVPRIVLAHNPDMAEELRVGRRVDLLCCGHTHGGQVSLPLLGTPVVPCRTGRKYVGGLCQGPRCLVLVSRGVGLAVLPVRFGVPPEIGLIRLERDAGA